MAAVTRLGSGLFLAVRFGAVFTVRKAEDGWRVTGPQMDALFKSKKAALEAVESVCR